MPEQREEGQRAFWSRLAQEGLFNFDDELTGAAHGLAGLFGADTDYVQGRNRRRERARQLASDYPVESGAGLAASFGVPFLGWLKGANYAAKAFDAAKSPVKQGITAAGLGGLFGGAHGAGLSESRDVDAVQDLRRLGYDTTRSALLGSALGGAAQGVGMGVQRLFRSTRDLARYKGGVNAERDMQKYLQEIAQNHRYSPDEIAKFLGENPNRVLGDHKLMYALSKYTAGSPGGRNLQAFFEQRLPRDYAELSNVTNTMRAGNKTFLPTTKSGDFAWETEKRVAATKKKATAFYEQAKTEGSLPNQSQGAVNRILQRAIGDGEGDVAKAVKDAHKNMHTSNSFKKDYGRDDFTKHQIKENIRRTDVGSTTVGATDKKSLSKKSGAFDDGVEVKEKRSVDFGAKRQFSDRESVSEVISTNTSYRMPTDGAWNMNYMVRLRQELGSSASKAFKDNDGDTYNRIRKLIKELDDTVPEGSAYHKAISRYNTAAKNDGAFTYGREDLLKDDVHTLKRKYLDMNEEQRKFMRSGIMQFIRDEVGKIGETGVLGDALMTEAVRKRLAVALTPAQRKHLEKTIREGNERRKASLVGHTKAGDAANPLTHKTITQTGITGVTGYLIGGGGGEGAKVAVGVGSAAVLRNLLEPLYGGFMKEGGIKRNEAMGRLLQRNSKTLGDLFTKDVAPRTSKGVGALFATTPELTTDLNFANHDVRLREADLQ